MTGQVQVFMPPSGRMHASLGVAFAAWATINGETPMARQPSAAQPQRQPPSKIDHTTYLERHHEMTNTALADIALMLARGDVEAAAATAKAARDGEDALWAQRIVGIPQT